jgi:MFS family permease
MAFIYAFFTITAYFTVPDDTEQHKGGFNVETFKKFDFLGAFLAISGIALFTAALTLAGNAPDGWRTGYVIAFLIVGILLLLTFVYWQSVFQYPLMPLGVWKDRNFTLLVTTLCLGFYGFSANCFWITLFWQRVQHASPLIVAVRLIPMMVSDQASQYASRVAIVLSFQTQTHTASVGRRAGHQFCCCNDHA